MEEMTTGDKAPEPIYRDQAGSTCVHFGHGRVLISPASLTGVEADSDELCFTANDQPHGIGDYGPKHPEGTTSEAFGFGCVRLIFDDVRAVRVLIEEAEKLERTMLAKGANGTVTE